MFYSEALGRDGGAIRPHPVTLIEEPEAHLHPHAISEVAKLLERGPRQVVATTHSPLLATSVAPAALLLVRHAPTDGHRVVDFGPAEHEERDPRRTKMPRFYEEEMEKLTRLAERPFGDLLFANAIVVGDGSTERAFLPPVLRDALGALANGISVIDSAGMNEPVVRSVIKFARHVEVPIVVFADADTAGRARIEKLVADGVLDETREVVWAIGSASSHTDRRTEGNGALERLLIDSAPDVCLAALESLGESIPTDTANLLGAMKKHKGKIGSALAREFLSARPNAQLDTWPEALRQLVDILRECLVEPREGSEALP